VGNHKILIILGLLVLLCNGCVASKKEVKMAGNVKTIGNKVSVNGTSSLEAGSHIRVELKDIESDRVLEDDIVEVAKDKTYSANFSRDEKGENQKLVVSFNPEEQPDDIKKIYGSNGENIRAESPGLVKDRKDGNEYTRIQLFDFIYAVEKGSAGQRTILLDYFDNPEEASSEGE
jgi:type 1 fimbria pilin